MGGLVVFTRVCDICMRHFPKAISSVNCFEKPGHCLTENALCTHVPGATTTMPDHNNVLRKPAYERGGSLYVAVNDFIMITG